MNSNFHSFSVPSIGAEFSPVSSSSPVGTELIDTTRAHPTPAAGLPLHHLVFVDERIAEFESVTAQLQNAQVFSIQSDRNGLLQISEVIRQYSNIASVHIISHGAAGDVLLGNSHWNHSTLTSQGTTLASWANHLSQDADILFYGCNVAADANGLDFVQSIAQITTADVAASTDITGNAALGGDWQLEVATGAIESADLLPIEQLTQYQGTLPIYNGNNYVLTSTALTWEAAQAEARRLGGNLVTINDAAEETWLRQTFGTEGLWIGINDARVEGTFEWASGETSTYRNWAPGEPNNTGNQDYAWMNYTPTGQWDDHFPTATLRGIIEIPSTPTFTYNGNTYRLTTGTKTWDEAQAEARSLGGNLVTINDAAEQTWLRQTFGTEGLWIGINDARVEGTFEWASGTVSTYRNWAPGEPNNALGNQDYAWMNYGASGEWDDNFPTATLRGIIEISPDQHFSYNGNTYQLTTGTKTWDEAQAEARSLGGNLVTINDAAEETWLRQTFGAEGLWIGMNDARVEGTFEWASGETSTYRNWAPGEPNNALGNQDYAWMNYGASGEWDDNFPTATLRGIIELQSTRIALADSATVFVGEAGSNATVSVLRIGDTRNRDTVEYTLNEIGTTSARAGLDYTTPTFNGRPNTGQIVFEPGETTKTVTIPIINDTLAESTETFAIGLQNPIGAPLSAPRTKLIAIVDNDSPNALSVSNTTLNVSEDAGTAAITVTRSGSVSGTATVTFATSNGSAIAGSDYTGQSGTLTFAPGEVAKTITIALTNDTAIESNETFIVRLTSATGAPLGTDRTTTVTIIDNDLSLGQFSRSTIVSGLDRPTAFDWTPDGRYMLVAQKDGVVKVVDNGTLQTIPLIDLSAQVNDVHDRGVLGLAVHPNFPSSPYVYLSYTYDPPETIGRTGLAGPDGEGNRPSRLVRLTVNPATMIADPASLLVLAGTNSIWAYTSRPDSNSTGDISIVPSGIVNGTTITAPASQINTGTQDNDPDRAGIQNQNIRDYLATDSLSHTVGAVRFGPDGLLYMTNGDGTSYNFADPRGVRVQDINNLSGKLLRLDPMTGQGVSSNPFFNGDPNSNQSKVFYSGLRNAFRFTFDPITALPVIGDVGWGSWEEINTGAPGANFGWPYLEGSNQTGGYSTLSQAISFYANGNRNTPTDAPAVFPLLARSHGAPDNASAIVVGDFLTNNTLIFGDVSNGTFYAATFDANRQISNVQVFDSGIPGLVDMQMEMGPDGRLYAVNFANGTIVRWNRV